MSGRRTTRRSMHAAVVASVSAVGLLVGAWGAISAGSTESSRTDSLEGASARHYVLEHLRARTEAQSAIYLDRRLADTLPNHRYALGAGRARSLGPGIVSGRIVDVDPGAGYAVAGDAAGDAARGIVVDPFAEDATWRIAELVVEVDRAEGAVGEGLLRVGLAMDAPVDFQSFRNGLTGQEVLLPLSEAGLFSHDRSLLGIARSGQLLGAVDEDGGISFPLLEAEEETQYLDGLDTVDEVFEAASRPVTTRTVDDRDGVPVVRGD